MPKLAKFVKRKASYVVRKSKQWAWSFDRVLIRIEGKVLSKIRRSKRHLIAVCVSDPRVWRLEGSLEILRQKPNLQITVLVIPFYHIQTNSQDIQLREIFALDLRSRGFEVLNFENESERRLLIRKMKLADVILTSQPYAFPFKSLNLARFPGQIAYLPYSFWSNERQDLREGFGFVERKGVAFLESNWHLADFKRRFPESPLRAIAAGFPTVATLLKTEPPSPDDDRIVPKNTLLWAPHWTCLRGAISTRQTAAIAIGIAQIIAERPGLSCLFRPHPLFRSYLEADSMDHFVKDVLLDFESSEGIFRADTEGIESLFTEADCLIHNSGSFIAEFASTAKPSIYTRFDDDYVYENLNQFGEFMISSSYITASVEEMRDILLMILSGEDPLRNRRLKVRNYLRGTVETDPSVIIAREVAGLLS